MTRHASSGPAPMHVAITGASSGIGAALARALVAAGHAVTLIARRRELLDALVAELGPRARAVAHDLCDPARAGDWIAGAEAALGPLDALVNNAGMENMGPALDADPARCRMVIDLNLTTPLLLIRHVVPAMRARGRGVVINVASVAAFAPMALQTYYAASKAGLAAFSEALRSELAGTGVEVITVYPGPVTTAMGDAGYLALGGREQLGRMPEGTPDELARRILRAIDDRAPRVIYPRLYAVTRYVPTVVRWALDRYSPRPDVPRR